MDIHVNTKLTDKNTDVCCEVQHFSWELDKREMKLIHTHIFLLHYTSILACIVIYFCGKWRREKCTDLEGWYTCWKNSLCLCYCQLLVCLVCPLLIPWLITTRDEISWIFFTKMTERIYCFYASPIVKFCSHSVTAGDFIENWMLADTLTRVILYSLCSKRTWT